MRILRITAALVMTMVAALVCGDTTVTGATSGTTPAEEVLTVLAEHHAAAKAQDLERIMATFSANYRNSQGADKSAVRSYFEGGIAQDVLKALTVNMEECEIILDGDNATATRVIYPMAGSAYMFKMKKEADGVWRIVNSEQIVPTTPAKTENAESIKLPTPRMTGGRPLMDVLKDRKTTRSFAKTKLPMKTLSNLLWAAWGINRPERNLHTAPTASNQQEIDVYVALEEGLYLYEPKSHELTMVIAKDLRGATGTQRFVRNVPLNLIFVADHSRMYAGRVMEKSLKDFYSAANTGYISQNVYLFCASEGLGTVVRGLVNREKLAKEIKLRADQKVILCQSVGYPKGSDK